MNRDNYCTPPALFAVMDDEFCFSIDVAASSENALCDDFFTEDDDSLTRDWRSAVWDDWTGHYVWANPPYSDIGPWVRKAAEQAQNGIGCVMLVMADTSVGWYKKAISTAQEVRFITGGRISFISPETGKPAAGNNKGSMFIIWYPYGRGKLQVSHIDRDDLLAKGREILSKASKP